jgi:putative flippase GtrA
LKILIARLARDERVRFLLVGGINTALGFFTYTALVLWVFAAVPFGYILSVVVSYAISITVAFVLYRRFVFRVTGHVVRDYVRFVSVYLVSIGINLALLPLFVEVLRMPPVLAQAIVLIITTLVSFFGHKSFSFRRPASPQPFDLNS